jgi:D-glycero-D-manno-heptose 1,7-bisphosphate phosphatase
MSEFLRKAVFLDRDGVILNDSGLYYITRPEDVRLNPGIPESLLRLQKAGFALLVISNQSGIGKGLYSIEEADAVNACMFALLQHHSIEIQSVLYCPHYPETGLCLCRKPDSLLFEKALSRWKIAPSLSWMIGDQERDIQASLKAGVPGLLVPKNTGIDQAVSHILQHDCR